MRRITLLWMLLAACRAGDADQGTAESLDQVRRGVELAGELGCARCHAGLPPAASEAPRLEAVGGRLTPASLRRLLADPASAGPGARMPDCLAGLEGERAREALVHFLVSLGGPIAQAEVEIDAGTLERGRQLYHGVGCAACHPPFEEASNLERRLWEFEDSFAPATEAERTDGLARDPLALRDLRARWTLVSLADFLADPLAAHPDGRMPALGLERHEAADLAAYLWFEESVGERAVLREGQGLVLEYFESSFTSETADFDLLLPVRREVATSFFDGIARREEDFGFRFRGFVTAPQAGPYTFATSSDDGSMLHVDGRLVVDNRGEHAMEKRSGEVRLERGRHELELTYFEHLGGNGLEVSWSGPGFAEKPLSFESLSHFTVTLAPASSEPFALDPALVEQGRGHYGERGCAACHPLEGLSSPQAGALTTRVAGRGCLAPEPPPGAPRFRLEPSEREALVAALGARALPPPPTSVERLEHELARLNCLACHARGDLGGPGDERRKYFQVERGLDLGDEGRLPPRLDRAGAKLKPGWLRAVLVEGARSRPYMKTRMPKFGAQNVEPLIALFEQIDRPLRDEREPEFSLEAVEAGKKLVGTKGLGCIQCHEFAGHPSLGIPAVDLARVRERVYPGWFRKLLMDPIALNMNTRMPTFWTDGRSPVKELYDGDPARQVDAIWTYLSLGSSVPLPEGLLPVESEYEVEVTDRPVCVGVFMEGVSPRTIAVGYPERLHVAFDVQNSRLAMAWRGRFLNARGTWHARAGQLEKPAGEDVLRFPAGLPFAVLQKPDDPWPTETGAEAGYRVYGRRYDEQRRPVFGYELGDLEMDETPTPVIRAGGSALVRRFRVARVAPKRTNVVTEPERVFLRAATGSLVRRADDGGSWIIEGERELRVRAPAGAFACSTENGVMELRVPLEFTEDSFLGCRGDQGFGMGKAYVSKPEVEYSW